MSTCVYKLVCTTNRRFYIGSTVDFQKRKERHMRDLRNGTHNNIFLQRTFDKYGEAAFKWKVIYVDTAEEARVLEQHYIDMYMTNKRCMNIGKTATGGDNLTRHPKRSAIIKRMTKTLRERMRAMPEAERKAKWGRSGDANGMYGRTHTKAAREAMRKLNLGRTPPNKGVAMSEEQKRKLSEQRTGNYLGSDNPFYGKHHTKATKKTLSEKARRRCEAPDYKHPNARRVKCEGKVYASVSAAASALGCAAGSILFRIKSPNFKYKYL